VSVLPKLCALKAIHLAYARGENEFTLAVCIVGTHLRQAVYFAEIFARADTRSDVIRHILCSLWRRINTFSADSDAIRTGKAMQIVLSHHGNWLAVCRPS
jgi:hypothetical protein